MKRIFSISLALLMLASNVGFSMNTHFCGGEAVMTSFSVGLHNPNCGMANMDEFCESKLSSEDQLKPKPCCENLHQVLQLDNDTIIQSSSISVNPIFFVAFIQAFVQPLLFGNQEFVHSTHYFPPIPDKDIQILFQAFLI